MSINPSVCKLMHQNGVAFNCSLYVYEMFQAASATDSLQFELKTQKCSYIVILLVRVFYHEENATRTYWKHMWGITLPIRCQLL